MNLLIMNASGSFASWEPGVRQRKLAPYLRARNKASRERASSDVRKRKIEIDSKIRNPLLSFDGAYTAAIPTFKFLVLCAHEKNRLPVAVDYQLPLWTDRGFVLFRLLDWERLVYL